MKKFIFPNLIAIVPILSTITISTYLFATPNKSSNTQIEAAPIVTQVETGQIPTQITIPTINVDLPVKPASVNSNEWDLYEDAASYLVTSGTIGITGNTVIYAHNWQNLFGPINNLKIGDHIKIKTKYSEKLYIVREKKIVSPADLSIVYPVGDQRLTLFTCTNFLDADRMVIVAKPATTFSDIL